MIPTHNRRALVLRAVESVLAQTVGDFELVVVDDGSTDDTAAALTSLDSRLRYEWQENGGASAARNTALRLASAPVVAFLDSDDRWKPNHLEVILAGLDRYPEAVFVSTCPFGGGPRDGQMRLVDGLPEGLFANTWGTMSCMGARREALGEIGGFDESIRVAEDADLTARLALLGPFVLVKAGTVTRDSTEGSLTRRSGVRDAYLDMLTASAAGVVTEIARRDEPRLVGMATPARAAVAYVDALGALYRRDEERLGRRLQDACDLFPRLSNDPDIALMRPMRIAMLEGPETAVGVEPLALLARSWPDPRGATPLTLRWWLVAFAFGRHGPAAALREAFTRPLLVLRPRVALRFFRRRRALRVVGRAVESDQRDATAG